ncbi:hypothetical protein K443DRAFT_445355 [Laccaria amethystina LaAM-08-1]|uniref:Uncharacterized protein n=1 Tax=Laccaria amethystina LaAM-08-1 TaxID=1095629 RepID=A0A0C9X6V6_9AGAR|nr:hypothetical protein K443DRAFT_445355 [Laccaria amethystina LaAM-08-1]
MNIKLQGYGAVLKGGARLEQPNIHTNSVHARSPYPRNTNLPLFRFPQDFRTWKPWESPGCVEELRRGGGIGNGPRKGKLRVTLKRSVELTKDPTDEDVVGHLNRNLRLSLRSGNSYTCALDLSISKWRKLHVLEIIQRSRLRFQVSICFSPW